MITQARRQPIQRRLSRARTLVGGFTVPLDRYRRSARARFRCAGLRVLRRLAIGGRAVTSTCSGGISRRRPVRLRAAAGLGDWHCRRLSGARALTRSGITRGNSLHAAAVWREVLGLSRVRGRLMLSVLVRHDCRRLSLETESSLGPDIHPGEVLLFDCAAIRCPDSP